MYTIDTHRQKRMPETIIENKYFVPGHWLSFAVQPRQAHLLPHNDSRPFIFNKYHTVRRRPEFTRTTAKIKQRRKKKSGKILLITI